MIVFFIKTFFCFFIAVYSHWGIGVACYNFQRLTDEANWRSGQTPRRSFYNCQVLLLSPLYWSFLVFVYWEQNTWLWFDNFGQKEWYWSRLQQFWFYFLFIYRLFTYGSHVFFFFEQVSILDDSMNHLSYCSGSATTPMLIKDWSDLRYKLGDWKKAIW